MLEMTHRRLARADVGRGDPQHDLDGRRDGRRRGRGRRARREPPRRGSAVDRDEGPGAARGRLRRARGSSGSSGSIRRSPSATGCPTRSGAPAAGTSSARTAAGAARRPGTRSPRSTRTCSLLMPCGYHLARDGRRVERDHAARVDRRAAGDPARPPDRARRVVVLLAARAAGRRRDRDARRDLRSRGVPRHRRRRPAGRRSPDRGRHPTAPRGRAPTFACLWCGRSWTVRSPDDLEGYAQLCPDCLGKAGDNEFLRFRLRAALEARRGLDGAADRGARRAGDRVTGRAADRAPRGVASTRRWSPTTRPAPASTTTGISAAAATRTARSTTPPGTPSWTRPAAGSTACRSSGRIVELAAGTGWWSPLLAVEGRAVDVRCRRRRRSSAPASDSSPTACAPTSTSAMRGRSRRATPADALFAGFWLSHVERDRTADVPRPRAALAGARRPDRADRLAARPAVGRGRPSAAGRRPLGPASRGRPRVHDRQGLPHAGRGRGRAARGRVRRRRRSRRPAGSSSWRPRASAGRPAARNDRRAGRAGPRGRIACDTPPR